MLVMVVRIVMIVLVRMSQLLMGMLMGVPLMRILWSCAGRMGMLMMRIVVAMGMRMGDFVVGLGMGMLGHKTQLCTIFTRAQLC